MGHSSSPSRLFPQRKFP
jgi:hypothetical protein